MSFLPETNKDFYSRNIPKYLQFVKTSRSPLTYRNYKLYLRRFLEFLNTINAVSDEAFCRFLGHLGLSSKTQGYHLIALRSFLKWKGINFEAIKLPKGKDKKISILSGGGIDMLLNAPTVSTLTGLRDKAILETLFATGMRVSRLVSLDRSDIDKIYLSQRALDWLNRYLSKRVDRYKPLFIRTRGKRINMDEGARLTPRSVQRMVKKYTKKLGLPQDVTPHTLRHSMAMNLLEVGAPTRKVQKILGHKHISTTIEMYKVVTPAREASYTRRVQLN